jgi:hypothetical protein
MQGICVQEACVPATPELVIPLIALVLVALGWSAVDALRPASINVQRETLTRIAAGATSLAFLVVLVSGNIAASLVLFACSVALIGLYRAQRP